MRLNKLFIAFLFAALAMGTYACGDDSGDDSSGNGGNGGNGNSGNGGNGNGGEGGNSSNVGDPCDATTYKQSCINGGANALICWDNVVTQWNCSSCLDAGYDPSKPLQVKCPKGGSNGGNACTASSTSGCAPACDPDGTKGYYWSNTTGLNTYNCYYGKTCHISNNNRVECICPEGNTCNGGNGGNENACAASSTSQCTAACSTEGVVGYYWSNTDGLKRTECTKGKKCHVTDNTVECIPNEVGTIFTFGQYEQDNKVSNGKEPIEWRVLDKNDDGQLLVISEKVLDAKPFNVTETSVYWHNSTIRSWLNGYGTTYNTDGTDFSSDNFINAAFTDKEKAKIVDAYVPAHANPWEDEWPGNPTTDKIFLLSRTTAQDFFENDADRQADATHYAVKRGAYVRGSESGNTSFDGTCTETHCYAYWLLRTLDTYHRTMTGSTVNFDGCVGCEVFSPEELLGIRPAMWVEFE